METDKIVQVIDELAKQARDEESIYRVAAADADGLSLTAFAVSRAGQCRARAEELEGIAPLYRNGRQLMWRHFARFARATQGLATIRHRRDDMEIVDFCALHNDAALRAYERALHLPLPANLRAALNNQLASVSDCYRGLCSLRRQLWLRAEVKNAVAIEATLHASANRCLPLIAQPLSSRRRRLPSQSWKGF